MKTSTRRWLGIELLGAAIIGAAILQFAGLGIRDIQHQSTPGTERMATGFHWALFIPAAFAAAGFLCVVIPGRPDNSHAQ
jgi:hypothetical protein